MLRWEQSRHNDGMSSDQKKPTYETDPAGFFKNLPNDPVWAHTMKKRQELRERMGWPPKPVPQDFPDYDSWRAAFREDILRFNRESGIGEKHGLICEMGWKPEFRNGREFETEPGWVESVTLMLCAIDLDFFYGDCSIEDVINEFHKRNAQ